MVRLRLGLGLGLKYVHDLLFPDPMKFPRVFKSDGDTKYDGVVIDCGCSGDGEMGRYLTVVCITIYNFLNVMMLPCVVASYCRWIMCFFGAEPMTHHYLRDSTVGYLVVSAYHVWKLRGGITLDRSEEKYLDDVRIIHAVMGGGVYIHPLVFWCQFVVLTMVVVLGCWGFGSRSGKKGRGGGFLMRVGLFNFVWASIVYCVTLSNGFSSFNVVTIILFLVVCDGVYIYYVISEVKGGRCDYIWHAKLYSLSIVVVMIVVSLCGLKGT